MALGLGLGGHARGFQPISHPCLTWAMCLAWLRLQQHDTKLLLTIGSLILQPSVHQTPNYPLATRHAA
eukprot:1158508-Pelagomonas_calceolata.AAC.36